MRPFIPNGCTKSPDGWDSVDWQDCCNLHDLAFYRGGFFGGLLPWPVVQPDGFRRFEWRYPKANIGLAKCIVKRHKEKKQPWQGRFFGSLYGVGTMLVSWTPWHWSWKERKITGKEWNILMAASPQQLARLKELR